MPVRHPPCTQRESERHDGGEGLRNSRDGETDRRHDHQLHGLAAHQPESEDYDTQRHGDNCQKPAEPRQPMLQRSQAGRGTHEGGDPAERAVGSGGGDREAAPASDDDRSRATCRCQGPSPPELTRPSARTHPPAATTRPVRLRPRERCRPRPPEPCHRAPPRQPGRNVPHRPVPPWRGGTHGGQGQYRLLCPYLLHDADRGVHGDHEQNHGGIGEIAGGDRQSGGHEQDQDQRVAQLLQHPSPHGGARLRRNLVGSVKLQSPDGLGQRQTRRCGCRAPEFVEVRLGLPAAPALVHCLSGAASARPSRTPRRSLGRDAGAP
jgi:hypothetical protein